MVEGVYAEVFETTMSLEVIFLRSLTHHQTAAVVILLWSGEWLYSCDPPQDHSLSSKFNILSLQLSLNLCNSSLRAINSFTLQRIPCWSQVYDFIWIHCLTVQKIGTNRNTFFVRVFYPQISCHFYVTQTLITYCDYNFCRFSCDSN